MDQSQLLSALLTNDGNTIATIQQLLSQQQQQQHQHHLSGAKDSNSSSSVSSHLLYPPSAVSLALSIESPFSGLKKFSSFDVVGRYIRLYLEKSLMDQAMELFSRRRWSLFGPRGKLLCLWQTSKNYATHEWYHAIRVSLLGRFSCSSPSTKELHVSTFVLI